MRSRVLILIAGLVLALGMLTSCGEGNKEGGATINDVQSLVAANKVAQAAVKNFHMDGDMDMNTKMKMEGLGELLGMDELSMPMDIVISMDVGRETAHGDTNTSLDFMGQSQDVAAEMYCDLKEGIVYTKTEGAEGWTKKEQDMSSIDMASTISQMGAEVLEKAEFSSDAETYKLTLSAEALGDTIQDLGILNDFSSSGVEIKDLKLNDGSMIYSFDKETALVKTVEMRGIEMEATGSMEGYTMDVGIGMDGKYDFSKYDELSPTDHEIPDEVKKTT